MKGNLMGIVISVFIELDKNTHDASLSP